MIEVGKNSIIIRDATFEQNTYGRFERAFSIYDTVTHKYSMHVYTVIADNIYLPMTIGTDSVQTYFPTESVAYNYANTPIAKKISYNMTHEPRPDKEAGRNIQAEAISFLQSVKSDKDMPCRMLNLKTGTGKTFVSIYVVSKLQQRAMIIVDTLDLANQWKKEFLFHTDMADSDVVILSGKESVDEAKTNTGAKIFIAIHKTLGMLLESDLNSINELMHKLKIGIRIFDECHVNFKSICDINSLSNVNYTIYLTATPNRSDYKEDKLYSKVFGKIPSYNGHKETNARYHTVVLGTYTTNPSLIKQGSVKTKYGFSMQKWASFVTTDDDMYNNYIASLKNIILKFKLIENKKKVAIMLPTIELINKTKQDLEAEYKIEIGKFVGEIPKDKRLEQLSKKVFLTTNKIFGKGIDVADLDCVINYVPIGSKVNVEQILGRLRNNSGHDHVLIDMTDIGFVECRNQQKARKRAYKSLAKSIVTIDGLFNNTVK